MTLKCARCKRPIRLPIVVEGKGYGPSCAAKVGDLLVQPVHRTAPRRQRARPGDTRQLVIAEVNP